MRFPIGSTLFRGTWQAWKIRVSEITRASRAIVFHCSDWRALRQLREKNIGHLPKVNE
jgi:hypothetical protein